MSFFILDANVALRFLLADDPDQSPKAKELFARAEAGGMRLTITPVAVAELVWVLSSFFEFPRAEIGAKLRGLLLHKGVVLEELDLVLDALERFSRVNADFPDCYAAAVAVTQSQPIASYDRDFRKFPDVKCPTPDEILKSNSSR